MYPIYPISRGCNAVVARCAGGGVGDSGGGFGGPVGWLIVPPLNKIRKIKKIRGSRKKK